MRLDKYLSGMSIGTRSEVKKLIKSGRVFVQKQPVLRPEYQVEKDDIVEVDGEQITYVEYEYYMMNKPQGCVCAVSDQRDTTVIELMGGAAVRKIFPVGRLDKDTEGLLLLTNDGALSHSLLSPKRHVWKEYLVKADGEVTQDDVRHLEEGVEIGDETPTLPARVTILSGKETAGTDPGQERVDTLSDAGHESSTVGSDENRLITTTIQRIDGEMDAKVDDAAQATWLKLSIREGRYHQIKRMMAAVGKPVIYLKRLSMGGLMLDESLRPGQYRPLTEEEVRKIHGN